MRKIRVWDLATRLFHWLLVLAFIASAYSAFQDKFGIYADIHLIAGMTVLILTCWRLVWGIWGSDTARFKNFVASPGAAMEAVRNIFTKNRYEVVGHNPLGGYAVVLMLLLLLVQPALGLYSSDDMFFEGPLAGSATSSFSNWATELHEGIGLFLIGLVVFHIVMILFYALVKKVNLVKPMITGTVQRPEVIKPPKMVSQVLALVGFLVVGGGVCLAVF